MSGLAPGLRWCKSCQSRTALTSVKSGKCPVCDPSQGNQVSQNAADELERIDSVLAGDVHESWGSGQASWSADGSHQDLEPPDDWYASILDRLDERAYRRPTLSIPRRNGRSESDATRQLGQVMIAGLVEGMNVGWVQLGHIVEEPQIVLGFDGSRNSDAYTFRRATVESWSMEIAVTDMADELVTMFWGDESWRPTYELDAWADDGGSFVASDV